MNLYWIINIFWNRMPMSLGLSRSSGVFSWIFLVYTGSIGRRNKICTVPETMKENNKNNYQSKYFSFLFLSFINQLFVSHAFGIQEIQFFAPMKRFQR